jgi:hypothetical protein
MTITTLQINKRSDGTNTQWNALPVVEDGVDWTTDINYNPGELTFKLLEVDDGFIPEPGDSVRLDWEGQQVFYGYIFKTSYASDGRFTITAYDKLRYLKNTDTIVWAANTASDRFAAIAGYTNITHRIGHASNYKLPAKIDDGNTFFDMIQSACEDTNTATGKRFYLRDVNGTVEFISTERTTSDIIIGDRSLSSDWTYEQSIEESANFVRILKMDSDNKLQAEVFASDANSMNRWGKLQKTEKADEKMNKAQMQTRANELLKQYNRIQRTMTITALGATDIRAGVRFYMQLSDLAKVGVGTVLVLASKVTHHFGVNWTMDIDVEI